jgi:hypothetical protein
MAFVLSKVEPSKAFPIFLIVDPNIGGFVGAQQSQHRMKTMRASHAAIMHLS